MVVEQRIPLITRLSLVALGTVEGGRVKKPVDPVAQWVLRARPELKPAGIAPAAYSTIRARTQIVDRMIADEAHLARELGRRICLVAVGGGLDARWYRLTPQLSDAIVTYREIDSPKLLQFKDQLLRDSPYQGPWSEVARRGSTFETWDLGTTEGAFPLVVLEGLSGRLTPDALRALLERIRMETPDARLILALPGYGHGEPMRWTTGTLRALGWQAEEDILLGPRNRLAGVGGDNVCPGMYPQRILRLRAGLIPLRGYRAPTA